MPLGSPASAFTLAHPSTVSSASRSERRGEQPAPQCDGTTRATVAFLQYSLSLPCETTAMRMRTNIRIASTECYVENDKEATRMSTHATGTFEFKSWDEKPYSEI